jgi:K+-transporting ATPase ATPase A chain
MVKSQDWILLFSFIGILCLTTPALGSWLARVFQGEKHILKPLLGWLENSIYKVSAINPAEEMSWKTYACALLLFSFWGFLTTFLVLIFQGYLPLNPQNFPDLSTALAFNTAVSFGTNTNWQAYAGESTMSNLSQMIVLTVHNFLSAASGIAVLLALARGLAAVGKTTIGNFWADLVRSTVYILLPLSTIYALFLVGQGVVQNFSHYLDVVGLEGFKQSIAGGPVASQEAIKMLGTNGGGFFNTNSAHPFENPTPISNFVQMLSIFLIPSALIICFGKIVKARKHAWTLFAVMSFLFIALTALSFLAENQKNPIYGFGALMEGKETRFGIGSSVLFSTVTTSASCGAVNTMHSSLSPLSGGIALLNMMLGEVIFGGVGAGLYGMIIFVILTVFLAGLMVGRTPEYLGKKIESWEMKMVTLAILLPSACILVGAGLSAVLPGGLSSLSHKGPHGLSEIVYAFTSAAANNGSAFAGLNANTNYWNWSLAFVMLIGRFGVILPALAIAGSLAQKKISPPSSGTFPTDSALFAGLLVAVIVIVGGLTFFPALTLGPIVEHLLMLKGLTL